jgi:hypothetical protein
MRYFKMLLLLLFFLINGSLSGQNYDSIANDFVENRLCHTSKSKIKKRYLKKRNIYVSNNKLPFKDFKLIFNQFNFVRDSFYYLTIKVSKSDFDTLMFNVNFIDSLVNNDTIINHIDLYSKIQFEENDIMNKNVIYYRKKVQENLFFYIQYSHNYIKSIKMGTITVLLIYIDKYNKCHFINDKIQVN